MKVNQILLKPILTEKATLLAKNGVYLFSVNQKSNKFQIKETIEKLYKVKVGNITVMVRKGKLKRVGRRSMMKKLPDNKMAYVKVNEGKIDLFPQT